MVLGKLDITCRRLKLGPSLSSLKLIIKINSKWIRDLNVRPEILKITIGKQGKHWNRHRQKLPDRTPTAANKE
jgi:hypothetical protein